MAETLTLRNLGGLRPATIGDIPATTDSLIYGMPKGGKTLLALTAQSVPEMGEMIYVAIERGVETVRDTYPHTPILYTGQDDEGRIFDTAVEKWERFAQIFSALRQPGHGYGTVVFDTLDELQAINIGKIMEECPKVLDGGQDPDIPSQREYGQSRTQMKRMIRMVQDLPMNVIWVCHAKEDVDDITKRRSKKPALVGQLQDEVGGMVNNLFYLAVAPATKKEPSQRVLLTAADGEIQAGTRSRVLNDMGSIVNPTMADIWYPLTGTKPAA